MLYTCNAQLPDSLQCASFKIPKLYDISHLKSDNLVLYKCKSQCKEHFTGVKHALHCALHLCISNVKHCKVL